LGVIPIQDSLIWRSFVAAVLAQQIDYVWVTLLQTENFCVVGEMGICTKPLARRTLPRVRGSAVVEG
jgi:hypothetical protein